MTILLNQISRTIGGISLREREGIQRAASAHDDELLAVKHIRDRRVTHSSVWDFHMPERRTVACPEGHNIAGNVPGEGQSGSRRHDAGRSRAVSKRVTPGDLSGLVIARPQKGSSGDIVIGASPSVCAVLRLEKIDSVAVVSADDQPPGGRVEAWRAIIGAAIFIRRHQHTVARGFLGRIGNGAPVLIEAFCPIHCCKGRGQQIFAIGTIEHEKVPVAGGLQHHLARLPVELAIHEDGHFSGIPVVGVMR